jgi:hypothetical protein
VFAISWIISLVLLVRHAGFLCGWRVLLATAAIIAVLRIRSYPLQLQNRVIRLEERLRLTGLLPESKRPQIRQLAEERLIALRFASDEEVARLVQRAVTEKL